MTAVETRLRISASNLKTSSKEASIRRIHFVPPRSTPKADSDGFVFPEKYLAEPGSVAESVGWKKVSTRGIGLRNCGNTCYMNSVLQALTHSSAIANDALTHTHMELCPRKKANMFCGYCALLSHVNSAMTTQNRSDLAPETVIRHLKLIAKNMRHGRQEDAHEFLRQLIDSCVSGELPIKLTQNPKGPSVSPLVRSTTFVGQLFSGFLQSQITCSSCNNVSRTFDPFMDISLEIQECQSLQDCLKRFTRKDTLSGQNAYRCSKCQKRVTATKQMVVHRTPPLLTIQLKRFNIFASHRGAPQKINRSIRIDAQINIAPYMSDATDSPLVYRLYAVIVHEGSSMGSGHYVCYAKAGNGLWYLFNDSSVHQVSEQTVLKQSAYILMYESQDSRCFYPSVNGPLTTPVKENEFSVRANTVTVETPTGDIAGRTNIGQHEITVLNHDEDESVSDSSSDSSSEDEMVDEQPSTSSTLAHGVGGEGEVPFTKSAVVSGSTKPRSLSAIETFCRTVIRNAVVRAPARKSLRMMTVMRLVANREKKRFVVPTEQSAAKPVEADMAENEDMDIASSDDASMDEPVNTTSVTLGTSPSAVVPLITPTAMLTPMTAPSTTWGAIPVSSWDSDLITKSYPKLSPTVAEPGARSQYDVEYDLPKSMHNPRSEFASGNGLPPSLKDAFNHVARGGKGKGKGKGKGGFGKGKGGFGKGKGKGKGGFGKGKGKGGFGKGRGFGKGNRDD